MEKFTHAELIEIGRNWCLNNSPVSWTTKPSIVITEVVSLNSTGEIPDVIGFTGTQTVLLEAKASRADFLGDRKKHFRNKDGMGDYRYYIAPKDLLKVDELPEHWGLIEVNEKGKCRRVKIAKKFNNVNKENEMIIILSMLRRIGQNAPKGVSIKCYTHETKNRASLTVAV